MVIGRKRIFIGSLAIILALCVIGTILIIDGKWSSGVTQNPAKISNLRRVVATTVPQSHAPTSARVRQSAPFDKEAREKLVASVPEAERKYVVQAESRYFLPSKAAQIDFTSRKFNAKTQRRKDAEKQQIRNPKSEIRNSKHIYIQFKSFPTRLQRQELEDLGVELGNYVSAYTYDAKVRSDTFERVRELDYVNGFAEIEYQDKLPERLFRGEVGAWAMNEDGTASLNVKVQEGTPDDEVARLIGALDGMGTGEWSVVTGKTPTTNHQAPILSVRLLPEEIPALAKNDSVASIAEVLPPKVAMNNLAAYFHNINDLLDNDRPDGARLSGNGVNIGMWDAGEPDEEHFDLAGRIVVRERSSISEHSTALAGTMVASGEGFGVTRGMAPGAMLFAFDFQGSVPTEIANAVSSDKVQVANNSWGLQIGRGEPSDPLGTLFGDYIQQTAAYDSLVRQNPNLVVVFSAGNDRSDNTSSLAQDGTREFIEGNYYDVVQPLATAKNAITVGAIHRGEDLAPSPPNFTTKRNWKEAFINIALNDDSSFTRSIALPDSLGIGAESTDRFYISWNFTNPQTGLDTLGFTNGPPRIRLTTPPQETREGGALIVTTTLVSFGTLLVGPDAGQPAPPLLLNYDITDVFTGINSLGTWTLFVEDVIDNDPENNPVLRLRGWQLTLEETTTPLSAYGPTDDGRVKPDVVAVGDSTAEPESFLSFTGGSGGVGLLSTSPNNLFRRRGDGQASNNTSSVEGPIGGNNGTSSAAAVLSGGCALLIESYRNNNLGRDPTADVVKAILIQTAQDLNVVDRPGPDYRLGYGLADFEAAVQLIEKDANSGATEQNIVRDVVEFAEREIFTVVVPEGATEPFKCTLVWNDEPGSPNAIRAIVNDLDLDVIDPTGAAHLPYRLVGSDPAAVAVRGVNEVDNVEQVFVPGAPLAGEWTIRVKGTAVATTSQDFALVSTYSMVSSKELFTKVEEKSVPENDGATYVGGPIDFTAAVSVIDDNNDRFSVDLNDGNGFTDIDLAPDIAQAKGSQLSFPLTIQNGPDGADGETPNDLFSINIGPGTRNVDLGPTFAAIRGNPIDFTSPLLVQEGINDSFRIDLGGGPLAVDLIPFLVKVRGGQVGFPLTIEDGVNDQFSIDLDIAGNPASIVDLVTMNATVRGDPLSFPHSVLLDVNDRFAVDIGGGPQLVVVTPGAYADIGALATEVQNAINAAIPGAVTVAGDAVNSLTIQRAAGGTGTVMTLADVNGGLSNLGLPNITARGASVGDALTFDSIGALVKVIENALNLSIGPAAGSPGEVTVSDGGRDTLLISRNTSGPLILDEGNGGLAALSLFPITATSGNRTFNNIVELVAVVENAVDVALPPSVLTDEVTVTDGGSNTLRIQRATPGDSNDIVLLEGNTGLSTLQLPQMEARAVSDNSQIVFDSLAQLIAEVGNDINVVLAPSTDPSAVTVTAGANGGLFFTRAAPGALTLAEVNGGLAALRLDPVAVTPGSASFANITDLALAVQKAIRLSIQDPREVSVAAGNSDNLIISRRTARIDNPVAALLEGDTITLAEGNGGLALLGLDVGSPPFIARPGSTFLADAVTFPQNLAILDNVSFSAYIAHPSTSDLQVFLVSPGGAAVSLPVSSDEIGGRPAARVSLGFNDFLLSAFNGQLGGGVWQIVVNDALKGAAGFLRSWRVTVRDQQLQPVSVRRLAIVPDNFLDGRTSFLNIPDTDPTKIGVQDIQVSDINVFVDVAHDNARDLVIKLTSPAGTSVTLHNRSGDPNAPQYTPDPSTPGEPFRIYDTTFSVQGPGSLSDFIGEGTLGNWQLTVSDGGADPVPPDVFQTINRWGIEVIGTTRSAPVITNVQGQPATGGIIGVPNLATLEDTQLSYDLTPNESDREDMDFRLSWSIKGIDQSLFSASFADDGDGDTNQDLLVITPAPNAFGTSEPTVDPLTGAPTSLPVDRLTAFNGESTRSIGLAPWTLRVVDNEINQVGQLNSWQLRVGGQVFGPPAGLPIPILDNDPNGITSALDIPDDILISNQNDLDVFIDITHENVRDLTITLTSPRGTLVTLHRRSLGARPDDPATTTIDESELPFDLKTLYSDNVVTLTLIDSDNLVDVQTIQVTVESVNDAPVFNPPLDQTLSEDDGGIDDAIDLTTLASDVETSVQGLQFSMIPPLPDPRSGISIDRNRFVDIFPALNFFTPAGAPERVFLQVQDGDGGTATTSFSVTINPVNDPPVITGDIDANPDDFTVEEDSPRALTFDLTAFESDVEDSGAALDWTIGLSPNGPFGDTLDTSLFVATIDQDIDLLSIQPKLNQNGQMTVRLVLTDSGGLTDFQDIVVTVTPVPDPPEIRFSGTVQNLIVDEIMTRPPNDPNTARRALVISLTTFESDPDGDPNLTWSVSQITDVVAPSPPLPPGEPQVFASVDLNDDLNVRVNSLLGDTPRANVAGKVRLGLVLRDSTGLTDEGDISVSINDAPLFRRPLPNQMLAEDTRVLGAVDVIGGGFATDGDPAETPDSGLLVSILSVVDPLTGQPPVDNFGVTIAGQSRVNIAPDSNVHGEVDVTFQVSDGRLTTTNSFRARVVSINDPPTISPAIASISTDEDVPMSPTKPVDDPTFNPLTPPLSNSETDVAGENVGKNLLTESLGLDWFLASGNPSAFRAFVSDIDDDILTVEPVRDEFGTSNIALTLMDTGPALIKGNTIFAFTTGADITINDSDALIMPVIKNDHLFVDLNNGLGPQFVDLAPSSAALRSGTISDISSIVVNNNANDSFRIDGQGVDIHDGAAPLLFADIGEIAAAVQSALTGALSDISVTANASNDTLLFERATPMTFTEENGVLKMLNIPPGSRATVGDVVLSNIRELAAHVEARVSIVIGQTGDPDVVTVLPGRNDNLLITRSVPGPAVLIGNSIDPQRPSVTIDNTNNDFLLGLNDGADDLSVDLLSVLQPGENPITDINVLSDVVDRAVEATLSAVGLDPREVNVEVDQSGSALLFRRGSAGPAFFRGETIAAFSGGGSLTINDGADQFDLSLSANGQAARVDLVDPTEGSVTFASISELAARTESRIDALLGPDADEVTCLDGGVDNLVFVRKTPGAAYVISIGAVSGANVLPQIGVAVNDGDPPRIAGSRDIALSSPPGGNDALPILKLDGLPPARANDLTLISDPTADALSTLGVSTPSFSPDALSAGGGLTDVQENIPITLLGIDDLPIIDLPHDPGTNSPFQIDEDTAVPGVNPPVLITTIDLTPSTDPSSGAQVIDVDSVLDDDDFRVGAITDDQGGPLSECTVTIQFPSVLAAAEQDFFGKCLAPIQIIVPGSSVAIGAGADGVADTAALPTGIVAGPDGVADTIAVSPGIAAGPDGVADTTADPNSDDLQIAQPGTTGLSPTDVVVDPGLDGVLQTFPAGDDVVQDDVQLIPDGTAGLTPTDIVVGPGLNGRFETAPLNDDILQDDVQLIAVGTSNLNPDEPIIAAGPNGAIETAAVGDDIVLPQVLAQDAFELEFLNVQDPPAIADLPDVVVDEDPSPQPFDTGVDLDSFASDVDGDVLTFSLVSVIDIQSGSEANSRFGVSIDAASNNILLSPRSDFFGESLVTIEVSDNLDTAQDTFKLTINPINDAPAPLLPDPLVVVEETPRNIDIAAFTIDVDTPVTIPPFLFRVTDPGNPLAGVQQVPAGSSILTISPTANFAGATSIEIQAIDNDPLGAQIGSQRLQLVVQNTPDPPVISTISPDPLDIAEDVALNLDLTPFEGDPDPGTNDRDLIWTIGPAGGQTRGLVLITPIFQATIDPQTDVLSIAPVQDQVGQVDVTLRLTDDTGLFSERDLTINVVEVPDGPRFIQPLPDVVMDEDGSFRGVGLDSVVVDPDVGSSVTFSIASVIDSATQQENNASFGVSIEAGANVLLVNPTADFNGQATVSVRTTDNTGLSAQSTFTLIINPINDPPEFDPALPDVSINEGATVENVFNLNNFAKDVETPTTSLVYQILNVTSVSTGADGANVCVVSIDGLDNVDVTVVGDFDGACDVAVEVSDGDETGQDTFRVNVIGENDVPFINPAVADIFVASNQTAPPFFFDLTPFEHDPEDETADPNDDNPGLTWNINPAVTGLYSATINPLTDQLIITPTDSKVTGVVAAVLTLSDSGVPPKTAAQPVRIIVTPPSGGNPDVVRTTLPDAIVGEPYSQMISAVGGVPPRNFQVLGADPLPGLGLTLDPFSGEVHGAPVIVGVANFNVVVADSEGKTDPTSPFLALNVRASRGLVLGDWVETPAGSASPENGGGISKDAPDSSAPSIAFDRNGVAYVAYQNINDNVAEIRWEIYVQKFTRGTWTEVGLGSASVGGISNSPGDSMFPSLAVDSNGVPYIAYQDNTFGDNDIVVKRFNSGTSQWEDVGFNFGLGGSVSGNAGESLRPSLTMLSDRPVVAWQDNSLFLNQPAENFDVFAARFDGASWRSLDATLTANGAPVSLTPGDSVSASIAIDGANRPVVAWSEFVGDPNNPAPTDNFEIYVMQLDKNFGMFVETAPGSASGNNFTGGISNNDTDSENPSVAMDAAGMPIVGWDDGNPPAAVKQIFVKRFDGTVFAEMPVGSASGLGVSQNAGSSLRPSLRTTPNPGLPMIAWQDFTSGNNEIYVRSFDGAEWLPVGEGSATGGGISSNGGSSTSPSLGFEPSTGLPWVAWTDDQSGPVSGGGSQGDEDIYVRRFESAIKPPIEVGLSETIPGKIEPGDIDSFLLNVIRGTKFSARVKVPSDSLLRPDIELSRPDNQLVALSQKPKDRGLTIKNLVFDLSGPHRLDLRGALNTSGAYTLSLKGRVPSTRLSQKGAVAIPGGVAVFEVDALEMSSMRIRAKGKGHRRNGRLDTVVTVFDPDGIFLAQNDDRSFGRTDSDIEIASLSKTGTYFIVVSGFDRSVGDFQITAKVTPPKKKRK